MQERIDKKIVVSLDNVSIAYRRRVGIFRHEKYFPIRDVSFDILHGETLGVIGRNGVGKSTILKLVAGIISPDDGEIKNFGVTASLLSLQVGFVQHLTGRENVILSGMILGLTKKQILSKMSDIYCYADIGEFFDQPVYQYSTGMGARLGFSVAVSSDPDIILLDEVLGVGDLDFRKKSSATMKKKIESNKTVVLVSHDMGVINSLCDRVVWLKNGHVEMIGDTKQVVDCYLSSAK